MALAKTLGALLHPGDRVLLEGPLGAGKTTFARALLQSLGAHQPPEGSPTFAIAHEYTSPRGEVAHIDLYRLRTEDELDEAGIPAYFWERKLIAILEWGSLWPEFAASVLRTGPSWIVTITPTGDELLRDVRIEKAG